MEIICSVLPSCRPVHNPVLYLSVYSDEFAHSMAIHCCFRPFSVSGASCHPPASAPSTQRRPYRSADLPQLLIPLMAGLIGHTYHPVPNQIFADPSARNESPLVHKRIGGICIGIWGISPFPPNSCSTDTRSVTNDHTLVYTDRIL